MRRIVDVFIRDRLMASYPVVIEGKGVVPSKKDFIDCVRDRMDRSVYSADDFKIVKFVVRKARGGPSS